MTYRSSMPFKVSAKHHDPNSLTFSMYTADEIRDLSVAEIKTPQSFNVLGHPYKFGLYDPRLGPLSEKSDSCGTCGKGMSQCVGHFGRIDLPLPVVNPLFHKQFCTIIKSSCLNCFSLHLKATDKANIIEKLEELSTESVLDSETYEQIVDSVLSKITFKKAKHKVKLYTCVNCQEEYLKPEIMRNKIFLKKMSTKINSAVNATTQMMLMANDGKEYLRKIWENDSVILKLLIPCLKSVSIDYPTDIMFLDVVPVIPPIVRPTNYVDGSMLEHPQTQIYKSIMEDCVVIRNISKVIKDGADQVSEMVCSLFKQIPGATATEKLQLSWQSLQANIDHLMDRDANKTSESANCQGLKQIIEKKAGIIRMHMMGKRVNFAARSVITPDPNLNIDEIGIPEAFALKLTYPVPVTPWNVTELRQLIMNGPDIFPGAVMIEDENGSTKRLNPKDTVTREAIAKRLLTPGEKIDQFFDGIKIVHRHLQNGDILLLNRQPTLHRPSLMAHKARILKGEKTIRMHYSNCKSYNADFDGDEMNVHFPQNEIARSEGYNIANVSNHYLVPKDGTPLGGLIQDHVISGVKLTVRGKFFSRDDYMQLVFSGLSDHRGDILLLPPTIIKPIPLWSGKQVVSTVIMNIIPHGRAKINLTAGSKISDKDWQIEAPREWKHGIKFKQPETMSEAQVIIRNGELLSGVLDKTHYGATTYGLIHCAYELYGGACSSRMLSAFGKLFLAHLQITGFTLGIHDILLVPEMESHRRKQMKKYRKIGNDLHKQILELPEDTPRDEVIEKIEESYSKNPKFRGTVDQKYKDVLGKFTGDMNNTCIKTGLLKKFPSNNLQLMVQSGAKGSTVNTMQISGHLGQIELEGKRPPLMISGRSLPSFAPYDSSGRAGGFIDGRFMTGIQPQEFFFHCMAGREGLIDTAVKTSRSGYLQRCCVKHLEGIAVQYDSTVRDFDGSLIQMLYGEDGLDIGGSKFLTNKQIDFLVDNKKAILDSGEVKKSDIRAELLNERLESIVDDYMNKRSSSYDKSIDKEEVKDILKIKSARAMCPPGESVGLLAAQSIGEPSTQMTLNTFHFAGRGEMNVTLGIPRLREILMTASKKIKTPSMEIPFKKNINNFEKKTNDLKIKLTKCMLNDVLKKITIQRKLNKYPRELEYTMRLEFLPYKNYKHKFCLSSHKVLLATEDEFFYKFFVELKNSAKKKEDKKLVNVQSDKENLKGKDDEDENDEDVDDPDKTVKSKKIKNGFGEMHESSDEEEVDEDDDATATKSRSKRQENQEYDDDDDDEEKEKEEEDNDDDDEDNEKQQLKTSNNSDDNDDEDVDVKPITFEDDADTVSRKQKVLNFCNSHGISYEYDTKKSLSCELKFKLPLKLITIDLPTVVRTAAEKTTLWEVEEINRAFIFKNDEKSKEETLKTDGINIAQMYMHRDILDVNRLYSNDVYRISQTYGIEAATNVIFQEVKNVFKLYGITVDSRHLSLIADYMTFDGTFRPLSRKGMDHSTSPLQQMTFESSLAFLKDATLKAKTDDLISPSSRLMLGQPCKTGTGAFGVYFKTQIST